MELRAAESKSLMRRRTVKVGRGAGERASRVTHAFLSSLFPLFGRFCPDSFFKKKNFYSNKKKAATFTYFSRRALTSI